MKGKNKLLTEWLFFSFDSLWDREGDNEEEEVEGSDNFAGAIAISSKFKKNVYEQIILKLIE